VIHKAKCDNKWSGTTTTSFHHDGYYGSHPRRGPWCHHHGQSSAIQGSWHQGHNPSHVTPCPTCCQVEPKPRTRVHHTLSSPLPWPSLLLSSGPLLWPSLLQWPSLLPRPSLLLWHSKQPRSAQDYLNHSDHPSSLGYFHHVSPRI
jgi:hypothetical protein